MQKDVIIIKSSFLDTLETMYLMSIGDGFSYLWKQLMSIPMSYLVYLIFLLLFMKLIFIVLQRFGVMKKDD